MADYCDLYMGHGPSGRWEACGRSESENPMAKSAQRKNMPEAKQTLAEQMHTLPANCGVSAWDRLSDEQAAEIEELLEAHWALPEGKRRSQKAIYELISNYLPFPVGITTVKQWILDRKPNG